MPAATVLETKEMLQPCLIYLHGISLVLPCRTHQPPQVRAGCVIRRARAGGDVRAAVQEPVRLAHRVEVLGPEAAGRNANQRHPTPFASRGGSSVTNVAEDRRERQCRSRKWSGTARKRRYLTAGTVPQARPRRSQPVSSAAMHLHGTCAAVLSRLNTAARDARREMRDVEADEGQNESGAREARERGERGRGGEGRSREVGREDERTRGREDERTRDERTRDERTRGRETRGREDERREDERREDERTRDENVESRGSLVRAWPCEPSLS